MHDHRTELHENVNNCVPIRQLVQRHTLVTLPQAQTVRPQVEVLLLLRHPGSDEPYPQHSDHPGLTLGVDEEDEA